MEIRRWMPPGVKHRHGATAGRVVSHTAVTESLDDRNVEWLEPVSPEQYGHSPRTDREPS